MGGRWHETLPYYNPFAQPRLRTTPVYSRDFAYANNGPVVLAIPMRAGKDSIQGTSAKSFAELLSGPTVDIYVGHERKHWSIHRKLLCHHSSYFEAELQGHEVPKTKKSEGQPLELPNDDPRGFELLVKWLYQGQLEDVSLMTEENKYDFAVACHRLYILCDKFDMIRLKNTAMDQCRRGLNEAQLVPDADEIDEIYRASPIDSPFRRLMVQIAARQIMDPDDHKDAGSYRRCFENNADFAVEMVNAIRYMSGGMLFEDPTNGNECLYHDHSDGTQCHAHAKAKARAVVNGEGVQDSSPRKPLPRAEPVERHTPKKLALSESQLSTKQRAVTQPAPTPSASPVKGKGALPRAASASVNGEPKRADQSTRVTPTVNGVAGNHTSVSDSASTTSGGKDVPKKISQNTNVTPKKRPLPSSDDAPTKHVTAPPSVRRGPSVDGIINHINGIINGNGSDTSRSQSDIIVMKRAPPKLRRATGEKKG